VHLQYALDVGRLSIDSGIVDRVDYVDEVDS